MEGKMGSEGNSLARRDDRRGETDIDPAAWRCGLRSVDCLRECCKSATGEGSVPPERDGGPRSTRRQPLACGATGPHGERGPRSVRRKSWCGVRFLGRKAIFAAWRSEPRRSSVGLHAVGFFCHWNRVRFLSCAPNFRAGLKQRAQRERAGFDERNA